MTDLSQKGISVEVIGLNDVDNTGIRDMGAIGKEYLTVMPY